MKAPKISLTMTIGQLARETGIHLETIRYYQRLGLMPKPTRPLGSVRRYGEDAVSRLHFIKRAQGLGFSLEEVRLLAELAVGEHCKETRTLAEQKMRVVKKKIAELRGIQSALDKLITACDSGGKTRGCPIIENLSSERREQVR